MRLGRNTGDGVQLCVAFLLTGMLVFFSALLAAPAFAQDELNCDDFDSQAEAQAELERDPGDPNNLDANDDGQACEEFNYDDDSGNGGGGNGDGNGGGGNGQVCEQVVNILLDQDPDQDLVVSGDVNNNISGDGGNGAGSIAQIIADELNISVEQVQECIQAFDENVIDDPGGVLPFTGGSAPYSRDAWGDGPALLALMASCIGLALLGRWVRDRRGW